MVNNLQQKKQDYAMKIDSLFNMWCWENQRATCKRISALSNTIHRNKLRSIKDLNVRLTTIKLLEENKEHSLT